MVYLPVTPSNRHVFERKRVYEISMTGEDLSKGGNAIETSMPEKAGEAYKPDATLQEIITRSLRGWKEFHF